MTCYAQSKTITDSVKVSVPQLRKVFSRALQADLLDSLLINEREKIVLLEAKISIMKETDSLTVASYEKEISLSKKQVQLYEQEISQLKKQIRREKRKRIFTGALGMASTITMGYLLIKK